jgi:hypothetical protein
VIEKPLKRHHDPGRQCVLKKACFLVGHAPLHAESVDKELLGNSMPSQDIDGAGPTLDRENDPGAFTNHETLNLKTAQCGRNCGAGDTDRFSDLSRSNRRTLS